MRACFENFGHLWLALGLNPLNHSVGSKVLLKARSKSASIETLIDLVAYL